MDEDAHLVAVLPEDGPLLAVSALAAGLRNCFTACLAGTAAGDAAAGPERPDSVDTAGAAGTSRNVGCAKNF